MSYTLSQAAGRVAAGEVDTIWYPRTIRGASKYGVVFFHGASTPDFATGNNAWPDVWRICAALANAGVPVIAPADGVDHFGNDTAMSRITAAITALATATGCSSSKAHLIGVSMGGGTITRYAALNPSKTASVNALIPMASIIALYRNSHPIAANNGFSPLVGAAWGKTSRTATVTTTSGSTSITAASGTFTASDVGAGVIANGVPFGAYIVSQTGSAAVLSTAATAGASVTATIWPPLTTGTGATSADLAALGATIKTNAIPGRLFYSTADAFIQPADVTALGTSAGWSATAIDSSYGHANGTAATWRTYNSGAEFSDLVTYVIANGA